MSESHHSETFETLGKLSDCHKELALLIEKRNDATSDEVLFLVDQLMKKMIPPSIAARITEDFDRSSGTTKQILERALRVIEIEEIQSRTRLAISAQLDEELAGKTKSFANQRMQDLGRVMNYSHYSSLNSMITRTETINIAAELLRPLMLESEREELMLLIEFNFNVLIIDFCNNYLPEIERSEPFPFIKIRQHLLELHKQYELELAARLQYEILMEKASTLPHQPPEPKTPEKTQGQSPLETQTPKRPGFGFFRGLWKVIGGWN